MTKRRDMTIGPAVPFCDESLAALCVLTGPPVPSEHGDARPVHGAERALLAAIADPGATRAHITALRSVVASEAGTRPHGALVAARSAVLAHVETDGAPGAPALLDVWRAARVTDPPPCRGCDAVLEAQVLTALDRMADAAAVLDPVLAPLLASAAGPRTQHADAALGAGLLPLLRSGQPERALACRHALQARPAAVAPAMAAAQLQFLRAAGNDRDAVELARTSASQLPGGTGAARLRWLIAAAHAAAEQVDAGHGADLVTVAWAGRRTEPLALADFAARLHADAAALAAAFDRRNGNRRRTAELALRPQRRTESLELGAARPLPVGRDARRRVVTLADVLACADPLAEAEEAVLSRTLADPVGVWSALLVRSAGAAQEAAARGVFARVLATAGQRDRCIAEAATVEAMCAATGDVVGAASARATAGLVQSPNRGLALAQRAVDELLRLPAGTERDAALCRARSAGVTALLALDALDVAERWMDGVRAVHPGQQVRVACQRAALLTRRGRIGEAVDVLRGAEAVATRYGLAALGVAARSELAGLLIETGDLDGAVARLSRIVVDLPAVPDPDPMDVPWARMQLARVLARAGRFAGAVSELEQARTEAATLPEPGDTVPTVDYWLGSVLRGLGLPAAALARLEAAAVGYAALGSHDGLARAERDRGAVLLGLERDGEAAAAFDAAAAARRADGDEWRALACAVDAAQARGYAGPAQARAELRALRSELSKVAGGRSPEGAELVFETARVDHALARCALVAGDVGGAAELAEHALAGYRAAGADRAVAALSLDAGVWWWRAGDAGSAAHYLRGALRTALGIGDRPLAARCEEALTMMGEPPVNGTLQ